MFADEEVTRRRGCLLVWFRVPSLNMDISSPFELKIGELGKGPRKIVRISSRY